MQYQLLFNFKCFVFFVFSSCGFSIATNRKFKEGRMQKRTLQRSLTPPCLQITFERATFILAFEWRGHKTQHQALGDYMTLGAQCIVIKNMIHFSNRCKQFMLTWNTYPSVENRASGSAALQYLCQDKHALTSPDVSIKQNQTRRDGCSKLK